MLADGWVPWAAWVVMWAARGGVGVSGGWWLVMVVSFIDWNGPGGGGGGDGCWAAWYACWGVLAAGGSSVSLAVFYYCVWPVMAVPGCGLASLTTRTGQGWGTAGSGPDVWLMTCITLKVKLDFNWLYNHENSTLWGDVKVHNGSILVIIPK